MPSPSPESTPTAPQLIPTDPVEKLDPQDLVLKTNLLKVVKQFDLNSILYPWGYWPCTLVDSQGHEIFALIHRHDDEKKAALSVKVFKSNEERLKEVKKDTTHFENARLKYICEQFKKKKESERGENFLREGDLIWGLHISDGLGRKCHIVLYRKRREPICYSWFYTQQEKAKFYEEYNADFRYLKNKTSRIAQ